VCLWPLESSYQHLLLKHRSLTSYATMFIGQFGSKQVFCLSLRLGNFWSNLGCRFLFLMECILISIRLSLLTQDLSLFQLILELAFSLTLSLLCAIWLGTLNVASIKEDAGLLKSKKHIQGQFISSWNYIKDLPFSFTTSTR
jgi:hypothetical protein